MSIDIRPVPNGAAVVSCGERQTEILLRALNVLVHQRNDTNTVRLSSTQAHYIKALKLVATEDMVFALNAILERLNAGTTVDISEFKSHACDTDAERPSGSA